MSRFFGKLFNYFLIFLVLCVVGGAIFLWTLDLNRYKDLIVRKASEALGRQVEIQSIALKVSLIPTVKLSGLKVANVKGLGTDPLLKVDEMEVTLSLPALIKDQKIELMDFSLGTADVVLIEKNGQNNWTFGKEKSKKHEKTGTTPVESNYLSQLHIGDLKIKRLAVIYTQNDQIQKVAVTDFSMQQMKVFSGRFFYQNYSAEVSGVCDDIMDLVSKQPDYLFNLTIKGFDAETKISGRIGDVNTFSNFVFDVSVVGSDLHKTVSALLADQITLPIFLKGGYTAHVMVQGSLNDLLIPSVSLSLADGQVTQNGSGSLKNQKNALDWSFKTQVELKDGNTARLLKLKPVSLALTAKGAGNKMTLSDVLLTAGKSDITANAQIELTKVPFVTGQIVSEYLSLNDFVFDESLTESSEKTTQKISADTNTIDLSMLNKINARLDVNLMHLRLPTEIGGYFGGTTTISLDNGVLKADPLNGQLMNGTVNGKVMLDTAVQPMAFTADLTADKIDLNTLKLVSDYLKGGQANIGIKLSATGNTPTALISSLSGNISAEVSTADIVSTYFKQLLKVTDMFPSKEQNAFAYSEADVENKLICGAVNMTFNNGVTELNKNIAFESSLVNFVMSGRIDLKDQSLSLSMMPSLGRANPKLNEALSFTQSLVVEGPFDNLKINVKESVKNAAVATVKEVASRLIEKQAQKAGISKTQANSGVLPVYTLCETALGRKMTLRDDLVQTEKTPVTKPVEAPVTPTQPMSPKDQLKQQLFNSLSEVLKKK